MTATLRLKPDGWTLEDSDGGEVLVGDYPLRETDEFVERAAESLDYWDYHRYPYQKVDERPFEQP